MGGERCQALECGRARYLPSLIALFILFWCNKYQHPHIFQRINILTFIRSKHSIICTHIYLTYHSIICTHIYLTYHSIICTHIYLTYHSIICTHIYLTYPSIIYTHIYLTYQLLLTPSFSVVSTFVAKIQPGSKKNGYYKLSLISLQGAWMGVNRIAN